ncbi:MAG: hypothetical protein KJN81_05795, partial [Acidimicrobiia bacterium]|nr:hypothetical protein [Acidimicrobiia bacterium]
LTSCGIVVRNSRAAEDFAAVPEGPRPWGQAGESSQGTGRGRERKQADYGHGEARGQTKARHVACERWQ